MSISDFDRSHQNENLESKIIAALERIAEAFRVLLWQQGKEHSLSPIQIQVLIFLLHHPDEMRTVSYLASEFNLTKATLSETIKSLMLKKLIKKVHGQTDRRRFSIQLSTKGKKIAQETSGFSEAMRLPILNLKRQNQELMLEGLLGIIKHLNASGIITIQRMCLNCAYLRNSDNKGYFCNLLQQELTSGDLRVDCPDHLHKA